MRVTGASGKDPIASSIYTRARPFGPPDPGGVQCRVRSSGARPERTRAGPGGRDSAGARTASVARLAAQAIIIIGSSR
jgi:hypothetical protein